MAQFAIYIKKSNEIFGDTFDLLPSIDAPDAAHAMDIFFRDPFISDHCKREDFEAVKITQTQPSKQPTDLIVGTSPYSTSFYTVAEKIIAAVKEAVSGSGGVEALPPLDVAAAALFAAGYAMDTAHACSQPLDRALRYKIAHVRWMQRALSGLVASMADGEDDAFEDELSDIAKELGALIEAYGNNCSYKVVENG